MKPEVDITEKWFLEWEHGLVGKPFRMRSKAWDRELYGEEVTRFRFHHGPTATAPTGTSWTREMFSLKKDAGLGFDGDVPQARAMEFRFSEVTEEELRNIVW